MDAVRRDGGGGRPESRAIVNVSYELSDEDQLNVNVFVILTFGWTVFRPAEL